MRKGRLNDLFLLMTGVIGGLSIAHFAGEDLMDDIHFWLTPLWLLLAFATWRQEEREKAGQVGE